MTCIDFHYLKRQDYPRKPLQPTKNYTILRAANFHQDFDVIKFHTKMFHEWFALNVLTDSVGLSIHLNFKKYYTLIFILFMLVLQKRSSCFYATIVLSLG